MRSLISNDFARSSVSSGFVCLKAENCSIALSLVSVGSRKITSGVRFLILRKSAVRKSTLFATNSATKVTPSASGSTKSDAKIHHRPSIGQSRCTSGACQPRSVAWSLSPHCNMATTPTIRRGLSRVGSAEILHLTD